MVKSVFETVKQSITVREAAQMYRIKANQSGMACCPFHEDKNSSIKLNKEYFYCFGWGATGDVSNFTAQLYNLSPKKDQDHTFRVLATTIICCENGKPTIFSKRRRKIHILYS